MKTEIIYRKVDIRDNLPETHSQHGEDFLSDEIGVWGSDGFISDKYRRTYDLMKTGTGTLLSEGWCSALNVTHILKEIPLSQLIEEYLSENRQMIVRAIQFGDAFQQSADEVTDAIITNLSKPKEE